MTPIVNFRAFWHPGHNTYGIQVKLHNGAEVTLPVNTPEEFIALLALLNGPSPAMSDGGHVISQR